MGGIYEVDKDTGGAVTRTVTYYPAGGAMRINITGGSNTVYYILKDHLGSASVVTSDNGSWLGEQRYYPYGETRLTTGTIYTDKLFTSQRDVGLGIYHYGARFYSPKTGRFLSPDSIVPGAGNPQAWNRYAYVLGNPIRYNDPTGHFISCEADEDCKEVRRTDKLSFDEAYDEAFSNYGVTVKGKGWTRRHKMALLLGISAVGSKFASERGKGETEGDAFKSIYGSVNFQWGGTGATGDCASATRGGCTSNAHQINFWSMSGQSSNNLSRMMKNVVHELGHAFDASLDFAARKDKNINQFLDRSVLRPNPICDNCYDWQQHPPSMDPLGFSPGETFGDMFIAWTYDSWNTTADPTAVSAAQNWMDGLVPTR